MKEHASSKKAIASRLVELERHKKEQAIRRRQEAEQRRKAEALEKQFQSDVEKFQKGEIERAFVPLPMYELNRHAHPCAGAGLRKEKEAACLPIFIVR